MKRRNKKENKKRRTFEVCFYFDVVNFVISHDVDHVAVFEKRGHQVINKGFHDFSGMCLWGGGGE